MVGDKKVLNSASEIKEEYGDIWQVWPKGHVHPHDVFSEESSRAAGGKQASSEGSRRTAVSILTISCNKDEMFLWGNSHSVRKQVPIKQHWWKLSHFFWFLALNVTLMLSLQTATGRFWARSPPGSSFRPLWANGLGRQERYFNHCRDSLSKSYYGYYCPPLQRWRWELHETSVRYLWRDL